MEIYDIAAEAPYQTYSYAVFPQTNGMYCVFMNNPLHTDDFEYMPYKAYTSADKLERLYTE